MKQAGAELCQAQGKLRLAMLWLNFVNYKVLICNLAYEFNFGAAIL